LEEVAALTRNSLQDVIEIHDLGVAMMRQNLGRTMPDATPEEVERTLTAWLRASPPGDHREALTRVAGSRP
jgi:hypothetical protein